jgi:hypothetical protein
VRVARDNGGGNVPFAEMAGLWPVPYKELEMSHAVFLNDKSSWVVYGREEISACGPRIHPAKSRPVLEIERGLSLGESFFKSYQHIRKRTQVVDSAEDQDEAATAVGTATIVDLGCSSVLDSDIWRCQRLVLSCEERKLREPGKP